MNYFLKVYGNQWANKTLPPEQDTYEYLVDKARRRLGVENGFAEIRDMNGHLKWSGYVDNDEIVEANFPGPHIERRARHATDGHAH